MEKIREDTVKKPHIRLHYISGCPWAWWAEIDGVGRTAECETVPQVIAILVKHFS